ncbi:hypothetical protein [Terrisporobacter mayombei]|uniref:Uncharacterized protein n=1 Tax=Terrisporobacter mayombei TaxID=1541 RepID=A0ABY9Q046_9FIRM|nr:hypothetical protein [Terrisporobacter mayombei]MCC3867059.1 hypothetical protein [Terrisporobacter mayombei]WMT81318.1 hypothetical protein TEMA_16580 [Terrisporobacter mayombei]
MSKTVKKVFYYIFTFVQIAMVVGLKVVHDLSSKKAGVNHHLRFYKSKYNNEIFTTVNLLTFKVIIGIVMILLLIALAYYIFKKKKTHILLDFIISILCCILLIWMLTSTTPMSLLVYPFMVLVTVLELVIEIIKIFIII